MPSLAPPSARLNVDELDARLVPAVLDLTSRGATGEIEGARFAQYDARPTGTGRIDSFLRVQGASAKGVVQQGYNTSGRPLQFDENRSPKFTRDLRVDELPVVNLGGERYREILLDVNQKSSQPLLSLDALKVYVSDTARLTGYSPTAGTLAGLQPVYDLDATADNWVKLDYRLNTGSGSGDMLFYVKDALLAGGQYVYLYSRFGEHFAANAGFQEWAAGVGQPLADASGAIAGSVFEDANRNGVRDAGEVGYRDVLVYLDANGSGGYDPGEVYTLTDADGRYSFEQLAVGDMYGYSVRVSDGPPGEQTTADPEIIYLAPGELRDKIDFGFYVEGIPS